MGIRVLQGGAASPQEGGSRQKNGLCDGDVDVHGFWKLWPRRLSFAIGEVR